MATRVLLRLQDGRFSPADKGSADVLRERGYRSGDVLSADLRKSRSPRFHRLVHAFGGLCAENLDAFSGMDSHAVIKRLQVEANAGCDEVALNFPGIGPCTYRIPRSISFASMSEDDFYALFRRMCRHVSEVYWPQLTAEEVERMAELMIQEQ